MTADDKNRCAWADSPWLIPYHDQEWGVPVTDDRKMFEFLVLDGFQAGLSWEIILKKRQGFQDAFAGFEIETVAGFDNRTKDALKSNPAIVRNKAKIDAAVTNAQAVLEIQAKAGSLCRWLWDFVDGVPIVNHWTESSRIPAQTDLSVKISKELKAAGLKFVGPTIVYAFLQSAGLVNDHLVSCFRRQPLAQLAEQGIDL